MPETYPYDFPDLISDAIDIWDQNAEWWDDKVGDGNEFLKLLIEPLTHELLHIQLGERVLNIACDGGRLAGQLVDQGARVTSIYHSKQFINRERKRSTGYGDELDYKVINAADMDPLLALGEQSFDAAVISMAIMDMAVISTPIRCRRDFSNLTDEPCFPSPTRRSIHPISRCMVNVERSTETVG